jgi:hypothetical protein
MYFEFFPIWFFVLSGIAIIIYIPAKIIQERFEGLSKSWGFFLEACVIFLFIFTVQQALVVTLNSKVVLDIQVDPNTEILSVKNSGDVPIEDVNIYPAVYITSSPDTFTATTTKVFSFGQTLKKASYLKKGQDLITDLDNSSFFIFYDKEGNLTPNSKKIVDQHMQLFGSPIFFESFGTTTLASQENLYYFFRISFKNSITKERQVRYLMISALKGANFFNSVPTNNKSGTNTSGSYPSMQKELDIKNLIFKQQQLQWGDLDSEYYNFY